MEFALAADDQQKRNGIGTCSPRREILAEVGAALAVADIGFAVTGTASDGATINSTFQDYLDNSDIPDPAMNSVALTDSAGAKLLDRARVEERPLNDGRHLLCIDTPLGIGGSLALRIDITRLKRLAQVFHSFSAIIASRQIEPDVKVRRILNLGCEHLGLPWGGLYQEIDGKMVPTLSHPPSGKPPLPDGLIDSMNVPDDPVLLEALPGGDPLDNLPSRTLVAPVLVDAELFGYVVFSGESWQDDVDDEGDKAILNVFSEWIGHELAREQDLAELAEAHRELDRIAHTDELTGIANRRHFMIRARQATAEQISKNSPSCIGILDIDHFKRVNDVYGHDAGDLLLRTVAQDIAGKLGAGCIFGRLGGEEFGLMLPGTALDEAFRKLDVIRGDVARLRIDCPSATNGIGCTVSIGLCEITTARPDLSEAMTRADAALYAAKRKGRDRVERSVSGHAPTNTAAALV